MNVTPRTRTRAAAAAPVSEIAKKPKTIVRRAQPLPPVQSTNRVRPSRPATPMTGLVTGIVELERRGESGGHVVEHVSAPRRLPDGTTTVAHVTVGGAATIQPAPYESLSIRVSLSLPSRPEPEHYQAAYDEALAFVERTIAEQLAAHGRG